MESNVSPEYIILCCSKLVTFINSFAMLLHFFNCYLLFGIILFYIIKISMSYNLQYRFIATVSLKTDMSIIAIVKMRGQYSLSSMKKGSIESKIKETLIQNA